MENKSCIRKCLRVDRIVLGLAITFIWSLLAAPIISNILDQNNVGETNDDNICTYPILYNGSVCNETLINLLLDYNESSNLSLEVASQNIIEVEEALRIFSLSSNQACIREALPFLCPYMFGGICLQNRIPIMPTARDCLKLNSGACRDAFMEWPWQDLIERPDCSSLVDYSFIHNIALTEQSSPTCSLNCREDFFCDNITRTCVPRCPDFNFYSPTVRQFADIMTIICSWLGFLAGVVVLVMSIIRRKIVLTFPSILVVYETITVMVMDFFQAVTYLDRESLYCTSPNLVESYINITNYCVFSGMFQVAYMPTQFNIWWATHTVILYLTIQFPHKIKPAKKSLVVVHVIIVIAAILVPTIPIVAMVSSHVIQQSEAGAFGVAMGTTPPIICLVSNTAIFAFFLVIPNCILALTGLTALIVLIWTVHKYAHATWINNRTIWENAERSRDAEIFKQKYRQFGIVKSFTSKEKAPLSSTEVKLLLVISYCILIEVLFFIRVSLTYDDFFVPLQEYFDCEAPGVDPSKPCLREFGRVTSLYFFTAFYCGILLFPAVCIIFVVDLSHVGTVIKRFFLTTPSSL